jgi:hypothetical protein
MMLGRFFKIIFKLLGWLILILLVAFFVIYAIAPIYDFPDYKPFSGDKLYNPYRGMDSSDWRKGNFQVQSRAWLGITNGRNNTNEAIQTMYRQLGYDIIVTSDYMKINRFGEESPQFIATYEHGYSVRKTHQVCLGSSGITWLDYPFYQNANHKQNMINLLREKNEIIALAHPDLRDGYLMDDMKKLTNYDLMEAMSQVRFSIDHWDMALSYGHAAFILGNDDAHDVFNPEEVGRVCTFINSPSLDADKIKRNLKAGNAFGARIAMQPGEDFVEKAVIHHSLPIVKNVALDKDTLTVTLSEPAALIAFVGQGGTLRRTFSDTSGASYIIRHDDSYIRTEITFGDGTMYYLNPVFRYSGLTPGEQPPATINWVKTWVQRGVAIVIFIVLLLIVTRIMRPRSRKGRVNNRRTYYYQS